MQSVGVGAPNRDAHAGDPTKISLVTAFEENEYFVSAVCDICGKHPSFGMSVSHSHRRVKRRWNPNIQRVRALVGKTPRRMSVCTSCLRAGKVTKAGR